jgi:hypothetical protein
MKHKKSIMKSLIFAFILLFLGSGSMPGEERISNIRYEIWVELDDENKKLHGKEHITC